MPESTLIILTQRRDVLCGESVYVTHVFSENYDSDKAPTEALAEREKSILCRPCAGRLFLKLEKMADGRFTKDEAAAPITLRP